MYSSIVFGEDDIGEIVSYKRQRIPVGHQIDEGFIVKYECTDWRCQQNCRVVSRQEVYFGVCMNDKIYHCYPEINVLISYYNNAHCNGPTAGHLTSGECYARQSDEFCCGLWPRDRHNTYFKYECEIWEDEGELRHASASTETENGIGNNMDAIVVVVMLSMVCIIGIIVGYLLYTERKKNAEKNKLFLAQR